METYRGNNGVFSETYATIHKKLFAPSVGGIELLYSVYVQRTCSIHEQDEWECF